MGKKKNDLVTLTVVFDIFINKRPMGHIAHLSNLGPCKYVICILFPFDPRGPLINLPFFHVRKLSCKIQLFWIHSF
jgi:hypothetical protein